MQEKAVCFLPRALVLDLPEIDAQHEALFAQLAAIKEHCLETNRLLPEQVDDLLEQLSEHFATEERLAFEALHYFAEHSKKHEKMLNALTKAFDEVRSETRDVFSLLRYIDYWFERHIAEEDRHLAARVQSSSAGEGAAVRRPLDRQVDAEARSPAHFAMHRDAPAVLLYDTVR